MPISFETTDGGTGYADIRVGRVTVHQRRLDAAALAGERDADGYLPPGLGITAAGAPAHDAATTAVAVIGPEAVKLGDADIFGNTIEAGVLNGDMIADNVGRALASTLPSTIRLA